jgi:heme exporter protein D
MIWNSWTEFWAMGGYGLYVWGSFGISAVVMVLEPVWIRQRHRQALQQLAQELQAQEGEAASSPQQEPSVK